MSTIQENIFGEDQKFTDMNQTHLDEELAGEAPAEEAKSDESLEEHKKAEFDCRRYRQFAVTVYIDIRNVLGHLVKVSLLVDEFVHCRGKIEPNRG